MSTLIVKRSMFEKIGFLDTKLVILEDWKLAIRLSRCCNLQSVEEPLALYRQCKKLAEYYDKAFADIEELQTPAREKKSTQVFDQYTLQVKYDKRIDLHKYLAEMV